MKKVQHEVSEHEVSTPCRSSHQRCSLKKRVLRISQNSQENTCKRASFLIKGLWHRCCPVNFAKFLRTPFLQNTSRRLLLTMEIVEAWPVPREYLRWRALQQYLTALLIIVEKLSILIIVAKFSILIIVAKLSILISCKALHINHSSKALHIRYL